MPEERDREPIPESPMNLLRLACFPELRRDPRWTKSRVVIAAMSGDSECPFPDSAIMSVPAPLRILAMSACGTIPSPKHGAIDGEQIGQRLGNVGGNFLRRINLRLDQSPIMAILDPGFRSLDALRFRERRGARNLSGSITG